MVENGIEHNHDIPPAKRHHTHSPAGSLSGGLHSGGPIRLEDISLSREIRERERLDRERTERERIDKDRERDYSLGYGKL